MRALELVGDAALLYVALYPVVTAAIWIAGGVLFRLLEERPSLEPPGGRWPGVTLLMPAFNEAAVIADAVRATAQIDYPALEVLVLDDGSTDGTAAIAANAAAGDARVRVVEDPVNLGKADRLNQGLALAGSPFVLVADADAVLQPDAVKLLVTRISRSERIAAVAGAPQITNRGTLLAALQVLEFSSIVGLIRRTQALGGRVGVVAGVIGLFRRDAVLAVGGYDGRMATEDIELTYRLLLAGHETDFEPHALVGMEVPTRMRALWMQRTRWARGQGEVLHEHGRELLNPRHHRLWLIAGESLASVLWLVLAAVALVVTVVDLLTPEIRLGVYDFTLAWGIAVATVASVQLAVAMVLNRRYDPTAWSTFLLGPLYPAAFWLLAATAAVRSEVAAIVRGPREARVVWDMPREERELTAP